MWRSSTYSADKAPLNKSWNLQALLSCHLRSRFRVTYLVGMRGLCRHFRESWTGAVHIVYHCQSWLCLTLCDAWRLLCSTVTISFHYYTYSHSLHEGLTPKTVQAGCHISWDNRRLLSGSVGFRSTSVQHWYSDGRHKVGVSAGRLFYWLVLLCFSSQCSVRCYTGYCRLLTNPHALPIAINAIQLLKFRQYR